MPLYLAHTVQRERDRNRKKHSSWSSGSFKLKRSFLCRCRLLFPRTSWCSLTHSRGHEEGGVDYRVCRESRNSKLQISHQKQRGFSKRESKIATTPEKRIQQEENYLLVGAMLSGTKKNFFQRREVGEKRALNDKMSPIFEDKHKSWRNVRKFFPLLKLRPWNIHVLTKNTS